MTDTENIPQGNCEISVKNPPRKSCMGCLTTLIVILALDNVREIAHIFRKMA